jgi:hypothetical protein
MKKKSSFKLPRIKRKKQVRGNQNSRRNWKKWLNKEVLMQDKVSFTLTLLFLILISGSCKNLKTSSEGESANNSSVDTVVVVVQKPVEPGDSLVLAFEKGACFGRCPVYKIRVYDGGFATYEGINFTKLLGKYTAQFSAEELLEIFKEAEEIGYFEMESKYDDPFISDLPSTKSQIKMNGKSHRVTARANVPDRLRDFHENLSVRLLERNWESSHLED